MVFVRLHRRATSVPVGGPGVSDEPDLLAAKNSYLFSRAAIDNADALSTASRRNDQQFLSDVNARIGNAQFSQPVVRPIKKAHVAHRGSVSPSVTRRSSIAVSSASRPPLATASAAAAADYDDDVDYQVKLIAPLTSRLTRYGGRAASVPPLGGVLAPSVGTVIYGGGYSDYPGGHLVYHAPTNYDLEITKQVEEPVPSFQKLNPVADLAVRQAHRNLDRIEREIQSSGDVIISRPIAPRTVLYTASTDGPWRRSLSYHGPRTPSYSSSSSVKVRSPSPVGRRYVHTSYAKSSAPVIGDDDLFDYLPPVKSDRSVKLVVGEKPALYSIRSHPPLPPPHPSSRRSTGLTDLHLTSSRGQIGAPVIASSSISQKVSSGSSPLLIRSSTDHSLPLHALTTPYVASSVPLSNPPAVPITPKPSPSVTSSPFGLPPISRPQVSDTRRKVRDVLCKVKGDPNYFD